MVAGLRAGHYLCFFGIHVLTPAVMDLLERDRASRRPRRSRRVLAELASREQYLALEETSRRYDIGVRYGLLTAQLALALSGRDRAGCAGATARTAGRSRRLAVGDRAG